MPAPPLTRDSLVHAARTLARRDAGFARVLRAHGTPPMWSRPPGFATLALIILEQQVTLAAARAAFARLQGVVGRVTAARVAAAGAERLRGAGLTRQKTLYLQEAAHAVARRDLRLAALARLDDAGVHEALTAVKGIGRWTADVWLLMVLRRPDPWPVGDRALQVAARSLWRLPETPGPAALEDIGERFRPYRAVAARLLWHYYLCSRRGFTPAD